MYSGPVTVVNIQTHSQRGEEDELNVTGHHIHEDSNALKSLKPDCGATRFLKKPNMKSLWQFVVAAACFRLRCVFSR